ncbi:MAG: AMP-binding protein [Planctomycetota bacterium]|jgi:acetyl-CoA synthetase
MPSHLPQDTLIQLGLSPEDADALLSEIKALPHDLSPEERWRWISTGILGPSHPFAVHRLLYQTNYAGRTDAEGPGPAWIPDPEGIPGTNLGRLMAEQEFPDYAALHRWSTEDRDGFIAAMVKRLDIPFHTKPEAIHGGTDQHPEWLPGAEFNITVSCLRGNPEAVAILTQQPKGKITRVTRGELSTLSARVANGLVDLGFAAGDPIAIDMPMTVEAVAAYLGIIAMGGVVVSISDSFAPHEIASRLHIARAKAIITQESTGRDGRGDPILAKVVEAEAPRAIVVTENGERCRPLLREGDLLWEEFLSSSSEFQAAPTDAMAPANILFSSGTTGDPKAIPWTHATPLKCAIDAWCHHDVHPGDVLAWPTSLGWMMGPWLVFAALINGASLAIYEGPAVGKAFGRFVRDAGATMLGLVPSLVKSWRRTKCMEGLDWSTIRAFSSTGECSNAEDMHYLMMLAGYKPVIEYCGGTEIGGGYLTGTIVQPAAPATFTTPALGLDLLILDEAGTPTEKGEVYLRPPALGLSTHLLNHDHDAVYFEGTPSGPDGELLRRHGDEVECLGGGFFRHHGRSDDTMNLKGIKLSAAELERAFNTVLGVQETAAIAVPPVEGGPAELVVYLVPTEGTIVELMAMKKALHAAIRDTHSSLCKITDLVTVPCLPRTASNKVMRRVLRDQYQQQRGEPS